MYKKKVPTYTCERCRWSGEEEKFIVKPISIMCPARSKNIQAFVQIRCPRCNYLVTIILEKVEEK